MPATGRANNVPGVPPPCRQILVACRSSTALRPEVRAPGRRLSDRRQGRDGRDLTNRKEKHHVHHRHLHQVRERLYGHRAHAQRQRQGQVRPERQDQQQGSRLPGAGRQLRTGRGMGQDQPCRSTVLVDLARRSLVPGSDPRSPGRGRRRQLPADLVAAEWRLIAAPSAPPQGGALFLCLLRPPASPVKGCAASGRHRLVAVSRNAPMTKARHPVNARVRTGPPAIRPAPLLLLHSPSTTKVASASTARGIGGDCEWRACRTTSGLRGILIACLDVLDCLTGAMGDMRKALYVFPDTNVFVQCQSLEELAWSDLGTFDLIVLLLSSPVIGEIDRQKGGAGRLAKRARTANTLIRRLLDEDSVAIKTKRKGPVVVVESGNGLRPSDDLREMLDYSTADDRLVGIVVRYCGVNPGKWVMVLAHDTGPLRTAKRVAVPFGRVPEAWLLPVESDKDQKRIRELEAQVRSHQQAEPRCAVKFEDTPWQFTRTKHRPLTEAQVAVLMRRLQERHPIVTDFGPNESQERPMKAGQILLRSSERFTPATDEEISKYRDESYPEWIAGCESFFRDLHVALDARQEIETLDITLSNAGSVPATDVLVSFEARGRDFGLSVPDDDEAEAEQILRLPNPPVAPKGRWVRNVQGAFSMLDHFARMGTARALPSTDLIRAAISPRPPDPNRFYWRNRRPSFPVAVAEFTCQQWRHREQEEHFSFRIALKLEVGTVEDALAVTIHAANLVEPVQATQKVRIVTEEVDIWDEAEAFLDLSRL